MIGLIIGITLFLATIFYFFYKDKRTYLEKQGVPAPPRLSIFGHIFSLHLTKNRWAIIDKYYYQYKPDRMFVMDEMGRENLHLCDLDLVKDIMVKEFDHFQDRREFGGSDKRLREFVSSLEGEKWKSLRNLLTPTFSSGKIKGMFDIISAKADDLNKRIKDDMKLQGHVNARELIGYFNMDVIAACAFGLETNCLTNRDAAQTEFMKMANEIMTPSKWIMFKFNFMSLFPNLANLLGISLPKTAHNYFEKILLKTMEERRNSDIKRGDYLDMLLELKNTHDRDPSQSSYDFTTNTVVSQSILFLLAGFDSTANSLAFTTYHLANNPEKQEKLRKELKKMLTEPEDFNYQNVHDCSYLDAVFSEAMRIHTPVYFLERKCNKDFKMNDTGILIPKNTMVTIPIQSMHNDPEYWKDPEEFQPERFLPENRADIVPFSYMAFGQGPRGCIATRFAQMNAKVCLAKLIYNFNLSLKPGSEEVQYAISYDGIKPADDGIKLVVTEA